MNRTESEPSRHLWHPVATVAEVNGTLNTMLMGDAVTVKVAGDHAGIVAFDGDRKLPVIVRFGFIWTSLGSPPSGLFEIPEAAEADRRNVSAGPVGVATSAPRAIENFLDMAHFPFVHTGILGAEPHTEVKDYEVELKETEDEILATRCRFFQPMAALSAAGGMEVDYVYRVPHPFCAVLYKSSGADARRMDVIAIFAQPTGEETIRAHLFLSMIDTTHTDSEMRRFQQLIFGQDKPILENQRPKRLPLDPRSETPIRADLSSIVYRRWLSSRNIGYGVIPVAGQSGSALHG